MSDLCDLCLKHSPRFSNAHCCKVRFFSLQPKQVREEHYKQVRADEGEEAMRKLMKEVVAEYRRRIEHKGATK
jgi:hypothetical protein